MRTALGCVLLVLTAGPARGGEPLNRSLGGVDGHALSTTPGSIWANPAGIAARHAGGAHLGGSLRWDSERLGSARRADLVGMPEAATAASGCRQHSRPSPDCRWLVGVGLAVSQPWSRDHGWQIGAHDSAPTIRESLVVSEFSLAVGFGVGPFSVGALGGATVASYKRAYSHGDGTSSGSDAVQGYHAGLGLQLRLGGIGPDVGASYLVHSLGEMTIDRAYDSGAWAKLEPDPKARRDVDLPDVVQLAIAFRPTDALAVRTSEVLELNRDATGAEPGWRSWSLRQDVTIAFTGGASLVLGVRLIATNEDAIGLPPAAESRRLEFPTGVIVADRNERWRVTAEYVPGVSFESGASPGFLGDGTERASTAGQLHAAVTLRFL